ncbi:hypothetical protein CHS0354_026756 [Potamilus streckersoni]|uniref:Uncharacterized protein n=1 Tax=Potamilus streckersoni TaxID=2493646 RepID=A0AAE0SAT4_9BIVA|nr:hypothetical protein CHS0354_026756 [Potamilus streckersoni]
MAPVFLTSCPIAMRQPPGNVYRTLQSNIAESLSWPAEKRVPERGQKSAKLDVPWCNDKYKQARKEQKLNCIEKEKPAEQSYSLLNKNHGSNTVHS